MPITVLELINMLESMPDDVAVVLPIDGGGHADLFAAVYNAERDAVILLPE